MQSVQDNTNNNAKILKKIIICVPYCEIYKPFIIKCLTSIENQQYNNYEIVIIVDGYSTELNLIYDFIKNKKQYTIFVFKENSGPSFSKWKFIEYLQTNVHKYSYNDIACIVDGDDYLENDALHTINETYQSYNCWVTYGNARGKYCDFVMPENMNLWTNVRKEKWVFNHVRSFKLCLLLQFNEDDFKMDNNWLTKGTDRPLVYNTIELSGLDRCRHIDKIIYNYIEHDNNSYKTVDYKTKMKQLNYIFSIEPKIKIVEDIHIVMCVYKRPYNLEKQLINLNSQSVSNRIHLHLINNNPSLNDIFKYILSNPSNKLRYTVYNCDNTYFGFQRFLTIRDDVLKNHNLDYVIIIDDDQIFHDDWVENMYNLRNPKTYTAWYVKKWNINNLDYWKGSLITMTDARKQTPKDLDDFHYGATSGCIIDVNIFNETSELWNIPKDLPDNVTVHNIEDLWLSYVIIKYYKWNIKRSFLPEKESLNELLNDSNKQCLWKTLHTQKQILFERLFTSYLKEETEALTKYDAV
jgi:glycosyltransferase involved in cell wall biosynthesis